MDSPRLARPWTPPETEAEPSPRSDYFSDSFRGGDSAYASYTEHRWPPNRPDELASLSARCDTPTEDHRSRPKPISTHTAPAPYTESAPFTPTKTFGLDEAHGAPRYPYTPDSSRIPRRNTEIPSSPTPWEEYSEHSSSPVQNALSSCIAHFENLIQTRQPDEDQMEYIVGQFEAMAAYLSAPDAQTRKTDDHLFAAEHEGTGLGISSSPDADADLQAQAQIVEVNTEYVAEVGRYISGVKKYIEDLKMRLDEVKTLNSIQLEVIYDLRRQMKTVRQGMRSSLSMREEYSKAENDLDVSDTPNFHSDDEPNPSNKPEHEDGDLDRWATISNDALPTSPSVLPPNELNPESRSRKEISDDSRDESAANAPQRRRVITIIHRPAQSRFWRAVAEALDEVGELMMEW